MVLTQTELNVENYFFTQIYNLFLAGSPTADVYTDLKQRVSTIFTNTHGAVALQTVFSQPAIDGLCNVGIWAGDTVMTFDAIILAKDRSTMRAIQNRLYDLLAQGRFRDSTLSPYSASEPSGIMRSRHIFTQKYQVDNDDELYGILMEFEVTFIKTREV